MTDTPITPPHRLAGLPAAAGGQTQPDPYDFSVVLGGPLYQMIRRAHLTGDTLELVRRRIVVISLFAWLPPFLLSVLGGRAWGDSVAVPFFRDLEMHVRFLLTLPLLIVAELVVHQRMRPVVRQFLERDLIPPASRARFDAAVAAAQRLRNSVAAEVLLIALVYLFDIFFWPRLIALNVSTWYAVPAAGGRQLSPAGWWFVYVSLPLFQFLLFRWYFRVFVWIRFLWQVSRCALSLVPTHPDRVGGLGFLSGTVAAFAPLLMAHGTLVASAIAARIFFQGATLPEFKMEVVVVVAFLCWSCSGRCCCSHRTWPRPGAWACGSTARWPSATCESSTTSGCGAGPRPARRSWGAPTSSPWLTWATASTSSRPCAWCRSRRTPCSGSRSSRWCRSLRSCSPWCRWKSS